MVNYNQFYFYYLRVIMYFILQLLNISLQSINNWETYEISSILNATSKEFTTVAFFGHTSRIEAFTKMPELSDMPQLVVTRNYGNINFNDGSQFNRKIFFIAVSYWDDKALWNHLSNALQGIQSRVSGVFITKKRRRKVQRMDMVEHFEWCWRKGFTNALVLVDMDESNVRRYQIYNYNHFRQPRIINMTEYSKQDLYPDKFRDLNRYKIRTLADYDPPRIFERRNCVNSNKNLFLGYVATLYQSFLEEYNADIQLLYSNRTQIHSLMDIIKMVNNDEIDVVMNPYVVAKDAHLSYPIRMLRRCVVVPFPEQLAKYKYFIMPFETKVWLSFLATWLIMSLAKIYGCYFGRHVVKYRSLDVFHILLEVWRIIMYLPSCLPCCYKYHKWFHAVWYCFIAVMGFILSNLYLASLTSFFSKLTFDKPINTLAELIRRNITVDAIDYEIPGILINQNLPPGLIDLLRPRADNDLIADILALKANLVYTVLEDRLQFALHQQTHLLRPLSHLIPECLTTIPIGFLIPRHSQFERPLNRFTLRCAAAGLIKKWILDSTQDGLCSGIISMRAPHLRVDQPLSLEHFQFGWFVLAGGYMVGFVVFLCENLRRIFKRFKVFIVYV